MPLWGNIDQANNAPIFTVEASSGANGATVFGNSTPSAFADGGVVGLYGVDRTEAALKSRGASPGWVLARKGTGPVTGLVIGDGGVDYVNTDLVRVSGGTVNASATVVTDANGTITAVTLTNPGAGFVSVSELTVAVTNATGGTSTGNDAVITATLGGRAGRTTYETLVAISQMTGDAEDTEFPDS